MAIMILLNDHYYLNDIMINWIKSSRRTQNIITVIEAARGFVITASKEDVQFLKVKLPMVIPGGCAVSEAQINLNFEGNQ